MKKISLAVLSIIFLLLLVASVGAIPSNETLKIELNSSLFSSINSNRSIFLSANFSSIENGFVGNITLNEFSDESTEKKLEFNASGNKTVYLKLKKTTNITTAKFALSGEQKVDFGVYFNLSNNEINYSLLDFYDGLDQFSPEALKQWINDSEPTSACFGGDANGFFNINYSINVNNWSEIMFSTAVASKGWGNWEQTYQTIKVYNYTSSTWKVLYNQLHDTVQDQCVNRKLFLKISDDILENGKIKVYYEFESYDRYQNGNQCGGSPTFNCGEENIYLDHAGYKNNAFVWFRLHPSRYPTNNSIDVGNNSIFDWRHEGNLNSLITTSDLSSKINEYLNVCSADLEGNCLVPLTIYSSSGGIISIANINVTYSGSQSCEACVALDGACDTEWTTDNVAGSYTDDHSISNCLYLWNVSIYNDAYYNISLRIKDVSYNTKRLSKRITLDRVIPKITLNLPFSGSVFNFKLLNFNWTATDNIDLNLLCNLTIDDIVNISNIATKNGQETNQQISEFADGTHYWNTTCWDDADNANSSLANTFFIDTIYPSIEFNSFLPSNISNNATLFLFANFSDSGSGFPTNNSCQFCAASDGYCNTEWYNVSTNYFADYLSGNCSYSWNTSNYNDGIYNVTIRINDPASNSGAYSKKITLDRTAPIFTYVEPFDNSAFRVNNTKTTNTSLGFTFFYRVEDLSSIANCSLIFNNNLNQTNTSIPGIDFFQSFKLTFATTVENTQFYNWSISCTDVFGHESSTATRKFTLIVMGNFSGDTTDLTKVNLSSIENLTFEQVNSGKIKFSEIVNLSGISDVDKYVKSLLIRLK